MDSRKTATDGELFVYHNHYTMKKEEPFPWILAVISIIIIVLALSSNEDFRDLFKIKKKSYHHIPLDPLDVQNCRSQGGVAIFNIHNRLVDCKFKQGI